MSRAARGGRLLLVCLVLIAASCSRGTVAASGVAVVESQGLLPDAARTQPSEPEVPKPGGVMEDLLHWAIQHSDPDKLKEVMAKYVSKNLTLKDVYGQEVIDALFVDEYATIARLIRVIADFSNSTIPDEELEASLDRVEEFVEQIDNAGNLHRMGGLAPLLDLGLDGDAVRPPALCTKALLVLGIAAQNNPPVQDDVQSLSGLRRIAQRLPRCDASAADAESVAFCGKLLFVASALVKNNATMQVEASDLGIFDWMLGPGVAHPSIAVAKKAMGMVETVVSQNAELSFLTKLIADETLQASAARSLLGHVRGGARSDPSEIDTSEKALRLISRLLAVRPMLFPTSFRQDLMAAAAIARASCERSFSVGDELCEVLATLATDVDTALKARDVQDDEL